jgi:serine protease Do
MFGFPSQQDQTPSPAANQPQNIGSGFIITKDGIIVTNKHVVSDTSSKYQVITSSNKKYDVEKIYRDPANDIAILKITPGIGDSLPPVELGDSSKLQVGQLAVAIGTPLGEFNGSVTTGIISGLGRGITAGSPFEGFVEQLDNVIQTDAAISPGNSGGPLINSGGQVIGVNTAVSQSGQNIGFAMPINTVKESFKNFNDNGQFNRPFLGVSYRMLTQDMALRYDLAVGAYVETVVPNSSADKAGVQRGDVITQFDGQKVAADTGELSKFIAGKKVGDSVKLTLYRAGKTVEVTAVLDPAPSQ